MHTVNGIKRFEVNVWSMKQMGQWSYSSVLVSVIYDGIFDVILTVHRR